MYTYFLKQEIILKIVQGIKIIHHEDLQYFRNITSGKINCVFRKIKKHVRLCSERNKDSGLETQGQTVREWDRNTGAE